MADDYDISDNEDQDDYNLQEHSSPSSSHQDQEDKDSQSNSAQEDSQQDSSFRPVRERPIPKPSEDKITPPFLTKYEKARIIGVRAMQISRNAPIYVDPGDEIDPMVIAQKELVEGKIPFSIRRYLPDNSYEDWPVKELKNLN